MNRMKGLTLGLGVATLIVVGLACGAGETPATAETGPAVESPGADDEATETLTGETQASSVQPSGMMIPRPNSVEELVARADVIVLGTIVTVPEEKNIAYGEDGQALLVGEEAGIPVTDFQVQIEGVLKTDGTATDGGTVVLRMFGHLSDQSAVTTSVVVTLPQPGDRMLLALGRNPDGTYGSGPEGLLNVDGDKVVYSDGVPFAHDVSPGQFMREIKSAVADVEDPSS